MGGRWGSKKDECVEIDYNRNENSKGDKREEFNNNKVIVLEQQPMNHLRSKIFALDNKENSLQIFQCKNQRKRWDHRVRIYPFSETQHAQFEKKKTKTNGCVFYCQTAAS